MATNNSINNQSFPLDTTALTIDPGVSGDSVINLNINSSLIYKIGVDDSDDDSFSIAPVTLGTNNFFRMSPAGERLLPKQSAFLGILQTADSNVTGAGATYTLGSGNALVESFDQNNNFVTTGTFTAPKTGKFLFTFAGRFAGLPANVVTITTSLVTSNATYIRFYGRGASTTQIGANCSLLADMDIGDTAVVTDVVSGGATDTADTSASSSTLSSNFFSGYLVC